MDKCADYRYSHVDILVELPEVTEVTYNLNGLMRGAPKVQPNVTFGGFLYHFYVARRGLPTERWRACDHLRPVTVRQDCARG